MFRMILILALKILVRDRRIARSTTRGGAVCLAAKYFLRRTDFVRQLKAYL